MCQIILYAKLDPALILPNLCLVKPECYDRNRLDISRSERGSMPDNVDNFIDSTTSGVPQDQELKVPRVTSISQTKILQRRNSAWVNAVQSLHYIGSLERNHHRKSDKISDVLVLICLMFALMLITLPSSLVGPTVVAAADTVFFAAVLFFIINRMGILLTLTQRQAVLVSDIIVGALLLGMLLSFNAMYFIACTHH